MNSLDNKLKFVRSQFGPNYKMTAVFKDRDKDIECEAQLTKITSYEADGHATRTTVDHNGASHTETLQHQTKRKVMPSRKLHGKVIEIAEITRSIKSETEDSHKVINEMDGEVISCATFEEGTLTECETKRKTPANDAFKEGEMQYNESQERKNYRTSIANASHGAMAFAALSIFMLGHFSANPNATSIHMTIAGTCLALSSSVYYCARFPNTLARLKYKVTRPTIISYQQFKKILPRKRKVG